MTTQTIRVGSSGRARISVDTKGLVGEAVREAIIRAAKEAHREEMRRGFDPDPRRIVDGRYDARLEAVKAFGRVSLADRAPMAEAALEVRDMLRRHARVLTGAYRGSVTIFVERVQVAASVGAINAELRRQPNAAIIVAPMVRYARRLERRYRTVDTVWRLMARRFGGSMFVSKHTLYASQVGLTYRVMRNETHGKKLATPISVEAVFPAIRIYRHAHVGTASRTVH